MALFAIGDLHLSLGSDKPMDIFKGWQDYTEKLQTNWLNLIKPEDTVVLAGDNSWAMKLENCREDFAFINALPGQKLMMKGNHDYWWSTRSKMDQYLESQGFGSIHILHNNSYLAGGIAVCGTRGWLFEPNEAHDVKVMEREAGRLKMSLDYAQSHFPEAEKVVFLHYPPVFPGASSPGLIALLQEYGVKRCYFGHLHGASIKRACQGRIDGIDYRLISADALDFCPVRVDG